MNVGRNDVYSPAMRRHNLHTHLVDDAWFRNEKPTEGGFTISRVSEGIVIRDDSAGFDVFTGTKDDAIAKLDELNPA